MNYEKIVFLYYLDVRRGRNGSSNLRAMSIQLMVRARLSFVIVKKICFQGILSPSILTNVANREFDMFFETRHTHWQTTIALTVYHMRMQKRAHKWAHSRADSLEGIIRLLCVVVVVVVADCLCNKVPVYFCFAVFAVFTFCTDYAGTQLELLFAPLINYYWNLLIGEYANAKLPLINALVRLYACNNIARLYPATRLAKQINRATQYSRLTLMRIINGKCDVFVVIVFEPCSAKIWS